MIEISNPSDIAPLTDVVVGPSKRFTWWDLIRESLRHPDLADLRYVSSNRVRIPEPDLARRQHADMVRILRESGARVLTLPDLPDVPIQVYPRDLAFAVDDILFLARPRGPIRRAEQRALDALLAELSRVERLDSGFIEGGDVIVTDREVLVGISEATDLAGVAALRAAFERTGIRRDVLPIEFSRRGVVHLDTKFAIVGPQLGYLHSPAVTPHSRALLAERFELIEATDDEARSLMINTFALAPDRILVDTRARGLSDALRAHRIEAVPLDFSEVTKFPGGLRCATLPLRRGHQPAPPDVATRAPGWPA